LESSESEVPGSRRPTMAVDPVCKMEVDETDLEQDQKLEYNEKTYFFCSPICKQRFQENPTKYSKEAA
jgi:YHS domain-containing protein